MSRIPEPLPLPDVIESDSDEAWKDFQDSVISWEHQFAATDFGPVEPDQAETIAAPLIDDEAFANIGRRSP